MWSISKDKWPTQIKHELFVPKTRCNFDFVPLMSCCIPVCHHQWWAVMMHTGVCVGRRGEALSTRRAWWHGRFTCRSQTLPVELNESEGPRRCHVLLADVWLRVRKSSGGSRTKGSWFQRMLSFSRAISTSWFQRSPVSGGHGDAGSGDSMPNDGTVEQKLRPIVFAFKDDARLRLNEDYSFQMRRPSSGLSSRTCQRAALCIAAAGWCTRKNSFSV